MQRTVIPERFPLIPVVTEYKLVSAFVNWQKTRAKLVRQYFNTSPDILSSPVDFSLRKYFVYLKGIEFFPILRTVFFSLIKFDDLCYFDILAVPWHKADWITLWFWMLIYKRSTAKVSKVFPDNLYASLISDCQNLNWIILTDNVLTVLTALFFMFQSS